MLTERMYAAIHYAEKQDFAVLPDHTIVDECCTCGRKDCDRPGKHPMTPNGIKDASNDLAVIGDWWNDTQGLPNVGIATGTVSKIIVIDIDVKTGGLETLAFWKQAHGELPKTPTVRTPTGGLHIYFKYPEGKEVGSRTGVAPGVDSRGNGGQIVAPPSIHMIGGKYEWIEPLTTPLAEIPEWLLDIILRPKPKEKVVAPTALAPANPMVMTLTESSPDLRTSPGAGEGNRHHTLCKLAGVQLARGDSEVKVTEDAVKWAETCEPPMELAEVIRTVKSLSAKHRNTPTAIPITTLITAIPDDLEGLNLPEPPRWPVLKAAAHYGLVGEYINLIAGSTEADLGGILVSKLVGFGNCVGRGPRFLVEGDYHHCNEFAVTVGQSSRGRKGTGLGRSTKLLQNVDQDWYDNHIASGLSSGEGVIWYVRDPIEKTMPIKEKGNITGHQTVVEDPGVADKRMFVVEPEFSQALRSMRREGNTLSAIIRQAWDRGVLRAITKNSPAKATNAHISILGHISMPELQKCLSDVDLFNGFANRFLWALVRRHQLLPDGGESVDLAAITAKMSNIMLKAKGVTDMVRSPEARDLWRQIYTALGAERPGLYGAATGRAEAHVLRLSMIYALLDGQGIIGVDHLKAALAVWDYCDESAQIIFGQDQAEVGDALEQQLMSLIRKTPGINRRGLHQALGGHVSGAVLVAALAKVRDRGQVRCERIASGGRPSECWFPCILAATA